MQSRNKTVVAGLFAGTVAWSASHVLPYGIEGGVLAGWATLMPDLDAAYEFACHYTKYPFAAMFFPFGRALTDRLHSWGRFRFLHSFAGLAFFTVLAKLVSMFHLGVYAEIQIIIATWIIFSLGRYLFHAAWRKFVRTEYYKVSWGYCIAVAAGIWAVLYGHVPRYSTLPGKWFVISVVLGVGGNIVLELLSARGVPLLWPLKWQVRIPIIGETGGAREALAVGFFIFGWLVWWTNRYPTWHLLYLNLGLLVLALVALGLKWLKGLV